MVAMLTVGVLKEMAAGERRVALVPEHIKRLEKLGSRLLIESGAGEAAGFMDSEYGAQGATQLSQGEIIEQAHILLQVQGGARLPSDPRGYRPGQLTIGFLEPYQPHPAFKNMAKSGSHALAVELIPRITRAQGMDALSSMANLAGYKGVIVAAAASPHLFPMMMTAAGTVPPVRVLVIGAGVAGLQAIATAKRLGAVVQGYDVRSEVREQIESLGASFLALDLTAQEKNSSGYAQEMDREFYRRQQELMQSAVAESHVLITTAAIPGKPSPTIISKTMVEAMRPGGVIVDLAAERGGNCELTQAGERIVHQGVTVIGDTNLPASMAATASKLYSKNLCAILAMIIHEGALTMDMNDEIIAAALIIHKGAILRKELQS